MGYNLSSCKLSLMLAKKVPKIRDFTCKAYPLISSSTALWQTAESFLWSCSRRTVANWSGRKVTVAGKDFSGKAFFAVIG